MQLPDPPAYALIVVGHSTCMTRYPTATPAGHAQASLASLCKLQLPGPGQPAHVLASTLDITSQLPQTFPQQRRQQQQQEEQQYKEQLHHAMRLPSGNWYQLADQTATLRGMRQGVLVSQHKCFECSPPLWPL